MRACRPVLSLIAGARLVSGQAFFSGETGGKGTSSGAPPGGVPWWLLKQSQQ